MSAAVAQALPPSILALFAPRPKLEFKPPPEKAKIKRKQAVGIAAFIGEFESAEESQAASEGWVPYMTLAERRANAKAERKTRAEHKREEMRTARDPAKDSAAVGDPFRTLFVGRLSYNTSEETLRTEFSAFGRVRALRIVRERKPGAHSGALNGRREEVEGGEGATAGKSRGYAFVEFEEEAEMKAAVKAMDGRVVDGRQVVVDVERGRTVRNWLPRRLGGGLGPGRPDKEKQPKAPPGGFRYPGGFGGGRGFGGGDRPGYAPRPYGDGGRGRGGGRGGWRDAGRPSLGADLSDRDRERGAPSSREPREPAVSLREQLQARARSSRDGADELHGRAYDRDRDRDRDRDYRDRDRDRERDRDRLPREDGRSLRDVFLPRGDSDGPSRGERERGRDYDRERDYDRRTPHDHRYGSARDLPPHRDRERGRGADDYDRRTERRSDPRAERSRYYD